MDKQKMEKQIGVLQCVKCTLYQVHVVNKMKKWDCKVCRHKQIVKKLFFRGAATACRLKAQKLNLKQGKHRKILEKNKILKAKKKLSQYAKKPKKCAAVVDKVPVAVLGCTPDSKINHNQEQDLDKSENDLSSGLKNGLDNSKAQDESENNLSSGVPNGSDDGKAQDKLENILSSGIPNGSDNGKAQDNSKPSPEPISK